MFISKKEKEQLQDDIKSLASVVQNMNAELIYLRGLIKSCQKKKAAKSRTPEQKAKQAAYMREWHAKRRQKEAKK
jgi:hypothetical protein